MNPLDTTPRVWYPASEKKLMLEWRTHDEGTHVILSRTQQGLKKTLDSVSKKFKELPEVIGVSLIQTGRPSDEDMGVIKAKREARLHDEFKSWVLMAVWSAVMYEGLPTPSFVKRCSCTDGCDECGGYEFLLRDLSWTEAFARGAKTWVAQTCRKTQGFTYPDDSYILPEEGLHVARADFGHHSKGIALGEADLEYLPETPLFFYQVLDNLAVPEWVVAAREQFEKQKRAAREIAKKSVVANQARMRKEEKDRLSLLESLFNKHRPE